MIPPSEIYRYAEIRPLCWGCDGALAQALLLISASRAAGGFPLLQVGAH